MYFVLIKNLISSDHYVIRRVRQYHRPMLKSKNDLLTANDFVNTITFFLDSQQHDEHFSEFTSCELSLGCLMKYDNDVLNG